mmetsp:Transcript_31455/g.50449  ORF Transcript_31455/g.50449 Transcript_31455/m.50449 type:complete len:195 (+) Transcript_31455:62-646(+)|eukprot:CAMPEP_0169145448 /NCGR_PEP_ID=MMETSP1015-20121227/46922_1 /TAXON_ID=342587 /ORGANISM="Karlodinium micrum, Strain CCMP2283" /LENGTH=194 /DNA_ID=CAMNT_0009213049 /DNA_START=59 /DNA_END=643 /DNA_ORIENTATION=+
MVRILELGAGTGASGTQILPELNKLDLDTHYVFSDLSTAFLRNARERFSKDFPFIEYVLFDAEKSAAEQGFAWHTFDIIFGTNVVHATSHLASTLSNVHRLLKPGGHFVLNEVYISNMNEDMTWGMTEGWWLFTDQEIRATYPLLEVRSWMELYRSAGFEIVHVENIGTQSIIVGQAVGDVLQPTSAPVRMAAT